MHFHNLYDIFLACIIQTKEQKLNIKTKISSFICILSWFIQIFSWQCDRIHCPNGQRTVSDFYVNSCALLIRKGEKRNNTRIFFPKELRKILYNVAVFQELKKVIIKDVWKALGNYYQKRKKGSSLYDCSAFIVPVFEVTLSHSNSFAKGCDLRREYQFCLLGQGKGSKV